MSQMLSVQIIGDKELKAAFASAPKEVAKHLGEAIEKTAYEVQRKARAYAPWQHGDLRRSIDIQGPRMTSDNILASVGTDKKYAIWQEKGTGIYGPRKRMITPKSSKRLAFKVGGQWVFAKAVKGTRPKEFMKKAHEEARPLMTNYMQQAISRILSVLAR